MSDMRNWKVFCALFSFLSGSLWGELLLEEDNQPLDREQSMPILSYAPTLERITPAVVGITTTEIVAVRADADGQSQVEEFLRRFYGLPDDDSEQNAEPDEAPEERRRPGGAGSGVILSRDGYIITNNHVVTNDSGEPVDEVEVLLTDGRTFIAEIVGADSRTDIAVLKIEADALPYATINRSDDLRVGDVVFAIGNPLNVGLTVTHGIISATGRSDLRILGFGGYEDFIQTDASINMGNSGGALVDAHGRLIGINTAILSGSGGNIGIGFAIPISLGLRIAENLIDDGEVSRGFLGVQPDDLDPVLAESFGLDSAQGAVITRVTEDSPALEAGLERGDIILEVGGQIVENAADLRLKISFYPPGTPVIFKVFREDETFDVEVNLANLDEALARMRQGGGFVAPAEEPEVELLEGVSFKAVDAEALTELGVVGFVGGLEVLEVDPIGDYGGKLSPGNIVLEWNGETITSLETAEAQIIDGVNRLYVWDGQSYRFVGVRVED